MPDNCIFCKIISGEIPGKFIYQDEQIVVVEDINPQARVHILVIPKNPIPRLVDTTDSDSTLLGQLLLVASNIAKQEGYEDAFRLVINNGADAGQSVFHLHIHILAGRSFGWPPG